MKKIGILTICLGKYDIFFDGLYNSFKNFFLPNHEKIFYVFNDSAIPEKYDVRSIQYQKMGWPFDSLKRFEMFLTIKDELLDNDFLFFLNANMLCNNYVYDEILPAIDNDFLVGVNHPGFYNQTNLKFPYERNPKSKFYIKEGEGKTYFQGCFNGGKSENFIGLSEILSEKINEDLTNNIMPIWHDESALNWFFNNKKPLILDPSYSYPENWNLPFDKKIIQIDKNKWGGHNFLRTK
jgi:hypothetical protein